MNTQMKLLKLILPHLLLFIIFPFQTESENIEPYQKLKSERAYSKETHHEELNLVHDYNSSRSNK
jgi:hypothetical protein